MNKLYLLQKKYAARKKLIIPWVIALTLFLFVCAHLLKSVFYANSVMGELRSTINNFEHPELTRVSTYQSSRFASTAEVAAKYTLGNGISSDSLLRYYCGKFSEKIADHWDKDKFWDNDKLLGRDCDLSGSLDSWTIYWCSKPRRVQVYVRLKGIADSQEKRRNMLEISVSSRLEFFYSPCG